MSEERCEQCKFHAPCGRNQGAVCLRYPPTMGEGGWASFPRLGGDGWCGEFKEKLEEKVE
jgi:hypothetical protein